MAYYAFIRGSFLTGDRLVYHRATWDETRVGVEPDGVWRSRTDCGILRHEGDDGLRGTYLSLYLAHRIARPCRRCFPDARQGVREQFYEPIGTFP